MGMNSSTRNLKIIELIFVHIAGQSNQAEL